MHVRDRGWLTRWWVLSAVVTVFVVHVLGLRYALVHLRPSGAVLAGLVLLVFAKHLGALAIVVGGIRARLRRLRGR